MVFMGNGNILCLKLLCLSVSKFYTNNYLTSGGTRVFEIVGLLEKDKLNQALLSYKRLNVTVSRPTLIIIIPKLLVKRLIDT